MIEPRLASAVQISFLKRLAEGDGGFATILRKGDPTSGAILIVGRVKGENPLLFERIVSHDGHDWREIADSENNVAEKCLSRTRIDPDLWIIELDVASRERLTDLIGTLA